jgi:hypothetical protein
MGKKKKKKNRKGEYKYTKKQFVDIYCTNCGLCELNPPDPIFCYEELYKSNPNKFLEHCFINLIELSRKLKEAGFSGKDVTIKHFFNIFCLLFCRKETCELIPECYTVFKKQINSRAVSKANKRRKNKKKRKSKKNNQYICQPYPTIFTNDSKEWQNKIENILSNGNNNREQDKVKESTKQSEGQINQ